MGNQLCYLGTVKFYMSKGYERQLSLYCGLVHTYIYLSLLTNIFIGYEDYMIGF